MDQLQLARQVLDLYDLENPAISAPSQSGAAVFRVSDAHGEAFSLRLHLPASLTLEPLWTRAEVIRSELLWLEALNAQTSLELPRPVANVQGSLVTRLVGVNASLLSWVEGEQKPYFTNDAELRAMAEMTASLHRQASGWRLPSGFSRPSHDAARLRHALAMLGLRAQAGLLDPADAAVWQAAGAKALELLESLRRHPGTWGMVHMDLLPANIIWRHGRACPIDFGACGFGFFLGDLAASFAFIHPSARRQYLEWYATGFELPDDHVRQLEALFVLAQATSLIHFLGLPGAMDWLPGHLHRLAIRELSRYVSDEGFLFSGTPFWEAEAALRL